MTQGLVLALSDFFATLITEAFLHHVDLLGNRSVHPRPSDSAMDVAVTTITGLLGDTELPANGDGRELSLKCAGRMALTESDRRLLGPATAALPMLGTSTSGN
ncbi:hypothetical protein [Actinoplanes teichomyceticus]|nr:hypothetical protein [Actinoplanes teichomyceticus]GIF11486.1 hypothetical protein Ate01nite_15180 [Actinoplanes teichomyceticus]